MRQRLEVARPELAELADSLERLGVEHGGAPAILAALALGPDVFVVELADDTAWQRFSDAHRAIADPARILPSDVLVDATTIGALTWAVLQGKPFVHAVLERRLNAPTATIH